MKNGNRYCPFCGHKLQKGGHDKYGKQRGRCISCNKIVQPAKKLRKACKDRLWIARYLKYITGTKKHSEYEGNRVTFGRNTKFIKDKNIFIPNDMEPRKVLHFDGKYVHHRCY